jgi:hypothetical protein
MESEPSIIFTERDRHLILPWISWILFTRYSCKINFNVTTRDSSVGIALGYELDDRGSVVWFPAGAGNFFLHHRVQNGSGAHLASYPMGNRVFPLGVKRPGCEADHSPLSSAEVKEYVKLYLHSPVRLHGVVLN